MDVGNSVRLSIVAWEGGELEAAMLHACNAIDGTAKKAHPGLGVKVRFTKLLRDNYSILGPMGAPGIDLIGTLFPVTVAGPPALDRGMDLAEVVYFIHRCSHGHGDELPGGFELLHDADGSPRRTRLEVVKGAVRLSDRVIFGLIAVAVLSPVNEGQSVPDSYYLTFGDTEKLTINDWWGRASDFPAVVARGSVPLVKLDFGDWMG